MDICLTFDYELFFGTETGSVEKCLLEPTEELLSLSDALGVPFTFFIDVGYLLRLNEIAASSPRLKKDEQKVHAQLRRIKDGGHSLQLHVHPHWEKATFTGEKWEIHPNKCYKLSDFSQNEARTILTRYKFFLEELLGIEVKAYRAGGWCIQPFQQVAEIFKDLGLYIDSSVMPGMRFESAHYSFNFKEAPAKCPYYFENDVCRQDSEGTFLEYSITTRRYSPFFFWRLYLLGRIFPTKHRMWGDGNFIPQPGVKKKSLMQAVRHHVSTDGYFASVLNQSLTEQKEIGNECLVTIGHPKSLTRYSLGKLREFIHANHTKHRFISLS
jgi:hypothetical protein